MDSLFHWIVSELLIYYFVAVRTSKYFVKKPISVDINKNLTE